jgi:hypothetical protein
MKHVRSLVFYYKQNVIKKNATVYCFSILDYHVLLFTLSSVFAAININPIMYRPLKSRIKLFSKPVACSKNLSQFLSTEE